MISKAIAWTVSSRLTRSLTTTLAALCFLFAVSFPDSWIFAAVGMLLWSLALRDASVRLSFWLGLVMGSVVTAGAMTWLMGTILRFTPLPWPVAVLAWLLLSAATGLVLATSAAVGAWVAPVLGRPLGTALALVVSEAWFPNVFAWQLGSPWIDATWLAQSADLFGVSVLGAVLLAIAMVYTERSSRRHRLWATATLTFLVGYGLVRTVQVRSVMNTAPRLVIGLVQPDTGASVRWDDSARGAIHDKLVLLTRRVLQSNEVFNLVVWSEAAFPYPLPHEAQIDGMFAPAVVPADIHVPLLVGALSIARDDRRYNSVFVRTSDGSLSAPVDKRVLVPFGESIPIVGNTAWMRKILPRVKGISPGASPELLQIGSLRVGVLNCFEDTILGPASEVASADVLVNMTNDAWFGRSRARWQHLLLARWRAIETRRELVRTVNSGVTCHCNALGSVEQAAPVDVPTVMIAHPRRLTLFALAPHIVRRVPFVALAGLLIAWGGFRRRKTST